MMFFIVPASAFQEQSMNKATVFRFLKIFVDLDIIDNNRIETNFIDRCRGLTGIVLHNTSEESLREEEPREPIVVRRAEVDPFVYEIETLFEFLGPGGQWFQGVETLGRPDGGNYTVEEGIGHLF